jgi:hypothetical protein
MNGYLHKKRRFGLCGFKLVENFEKGILSDGIDALIV